MTTLGQNAQRSFLCGFTNVVFFYISKTSNGKRKHAQRLLLKDLAV